LAGDEAQSVDEPVDRYGGVDQAEQSEPDTERKHDGGSFALGPTVWNTGCNSWYLTDEGNVDLWPYDRRTMTDMLARPDDRDYHVTWAVPAT